MPISYELRPKTASGGIVLDIAKFRFMIPYAGLPFLGTALLISRFDAMDGIVLLWCMLLITFGYIAAVTDLKTKTVSNKLVLAMLAAWAVTAVPLVFYDMTDAALLLIDSALGFSAGGGLFLLVYIVSRKGLGGGDVKFMAAAGLYLGLNGAIPAIFCGTLIAALTGLTLMILKKIGRKDTMPLTPFLYLGILITIFFL